jgi:hypothetical protein
VIRRISVAVISERDAMLPDSWNIAFVGGTVRRGTLCVSLASIAVMFR